MGLRRRDLLQSGSLSALGLALPAAAAARQTPEKACILLVLVGGPSQLDTWDPKPNAPSGIRSPYQPIRTNVPGIQISEIFPRMARQADQYAIIRSMYHTGAAVHDTGHQLVQTGRLCQGGVEHPHIGCVAGKLFGSQHVMLPYAIGNTGGNMPHGQTAGYLGDEHEPVMMEAESLRSEPAAVRDRYGRNKFGESCLRARRLVESGVRFVTVNMFETVFDEISWDIHGSRPFSPMTAYRDIVAPMFDMAYTALLSDLRERGLLDSTLVVATGEFGRTPRINPAGGRDHWTQCWSALVAGGGVRGGQVIGSSDAIAGEPKDRPVSPAELAATVYHSLGIPLDTRIAGDVRAVDAGVQPVYELFA